MVPLASRTDTPDEGGLTILLHRMTSRSRTAILDPEQVAAARSMRPDAGEPVGRGGLGSYLRPFGFPSHGEEKVYGSIP
jgi:hypothetical protein